MINTYHIPVLLEEVIHYLDPKPGQVFIDGTVGQGGHAKIILEHIVPGGRLLAIDKDPRNLAVVKEYLAVYSQSVVFICDSYRNLKSLALAHGFSSIDGILLDLGFCSSQIEEADRGFSFLHEGPLDMRYHPEDLLTAKEIINEWSQEALKDIFIRFGEEKEAEKIAVKIVRERKHKPIRTTTQLAELISFIMTRRGKIHPATKVFQALRLAVNHELSELEEGLPQAISLLKQGGRLAVISFHSLEDRIVKQFFKQQEQKGFIHRLTPFVLTPTKEEQQKNKRARSAKLRVIQKI